MAHGLRYLEFRCTGCGHCCRDLRVAVTGADVRRLVEATGQPAASVVAWLEPDVVDMRGEPQGFVQLRQGRRLMVLAQHSEACQYLHEAQCSVYGARPLSCRLYPFDAQFGKRGGVRRLRLLGGTDCDFARDGHNSERALHALHTRHASELTAYFDQVAAFNRQQWRRTQLGRLPATATAFLDFLGLVGAGDER